MVQLMDWKLFKMTSMKNARPKNLNSRRKKKL